VARVAQLIALKPDTPGLWPGVFLLVLATSLGCAREDSRYLTAAEVDSKAFPLRNVELDFPRTADGAEYYGALKLNVFISAAGRVERVEVVEATLPASFRDAAVRTFSEVRWEPARKAGARVKSVKAIEVRYDPPLRGMDRPAMQPDR
jgi:hypothetical protein